MTLEQLRIFIAVAEREHITRAAEVLHLTQSAVSAAVAALEGRHNISLFHRIGRRIELTEAGRLFLDEARGVLARAASAEQAISELSGLQRGSLSVHASQTIANYWLPRRLLAFRRLYPGIDITLGVGNTQQVAKAVIDGLAEIGFVEGSIDAPVLSQQIVGHDRLVIVESVERPSLPGAPTPADLQRVAWVLREAGSGTRSQFELALAQLGIAAADLNVVLELPSNEAVRAAVEAGAGATAISELVAASGIASGSLRRVGFDLPQRPFHALRHKERHRSKAGQALMKIIADDEARPAAREQAVGRPAA